LALESLFNQYSGSQAENKQNVQQTRSSNQNGIYPNLTEIGEEEVQESVAMETNIRSRKRSRDEGKPGTSKEFPILINDSIDGEDEINFEIELEKAKKQEHENKLTEKEN